jgi:hypothetical protein
VAVRDVSAPTEALAASGVAMADPPATTDAASVHAAELQAVKLRAVKKIKALEERLKKAGDDAATEQAVGLVACSALAVEVEALEADAGASETLRAALLQQQKEESSLSGALQALRLSQADQEDAHAREIGSLKEEVLSLQEERERLLDAEAAATSEISALRTQVEEARRAEAEARAAARQEAERFQRQDAAQREKARAATAARQSDYHARPTRHHWWSCRTACADCQAEGPAQ